MPNQHVKTFESDVYHGHGEKIDDQINHYLAAHPGLVIVAISRSIYHNLSSRQVNHSESALPEYGEITQQCTVVFEGKI